MNERQSVSEERASYNNKPKSSVLGNTNNNF